jgi:6-hydroxynicotinate reductase
VTTMPDNSFGYVPTPAIVGPIEFTMSRADYLALGGHGDFIRPVESIRNIERVKTIPWTPAHPWPLAPVGESR